MNQHSHTGWLTDMTERIAQLKRDLAAMTKAHGVAECLEYLGRIAALEGALKVAQDTIEHAERWATHKNDKQFFQSAKERIEAALGGP